MPSHFQDDEWRPKLDGNQSRSLDAGPKPHRFLGRNCGGQPWPVLRRGRFRHRTLQNSKRSDLGGYERWSGMVYERRFCQLDRCHQEYFWVASQGTITSIAPSTFEAGTAYIAVDFHMMDN